MWHFGGDSSIEYTRERFYARMEVGENALLYYHPYLNHSYFVGVFTAGRDGKDGRSHMVQSFPLFSIGFGGVL